MEHVKFQDFVSKRINKTGILLEGKKATYEYGCIMAHIDVWNWKSRLAMIAEEDLYVKEENGDRYGKETEPHVTLLYGIHSKEANAQEILDYLRNLKPVTVRITGISIFENNEYDVVKYTIESDELHALNAEIKERFPYTSTYPTYKPHMTIAYVKKGQGKKYVKDLDSEHFYSDTFEYSMAFDDFKQDFFVRSKHGMNGDLTVNFQGVDAEQAAGLKKLFAYMQYCAEVGSSRNINVWVDGDGRFRATILVDGNKIESAPESEDTGEAFEVYID